MSQDHNHLNHADMGMQVHAEVPQGRAATSFRRSGRDEEMIRAYTRNLELAHKQLDQMQLSSRPHKLQLSVPESFITAFGGSPSNPQLCWGLLACCAPPMTACSRAR